MATTREVQLGNALAKSIEAAGMNLAQFLDRDTLHGAEELMTRHAASNGLISIFTSKRYDEDLEAATSTATTRPFGIEVNTLSPSIQLVLNPIMIYPADEGFITEAKKLGYKVRTRGPQAMLYVLDGFSKEKGQVKNMAANLLFISRMVDGLIEGRYPLKEGERSPQFGELVRDAFSLVRTYTTALDEPGRANLSPRIARLALLDDEGLEKEARNFVLYETEPLKMQGLIELTEADEQEESPKQAVQSGNSYLHISERNLPLRVATTKSKDIPHKPWEEYGRNRWNRSHQLFGRYEVAEAGLRVDFKIDSTHFPGKYHFFDTIEIIQEAEGERKQVILGQEVDKEKEETAELNAWADPAFLDQLFHKADFVLPVIVAGNFDFLKEPSRGYLEQLAQDKGTKQDVAAVLRDVLALASQGQLRSIEGYLRRN